LIKQEKVANSLIVHSYFYMPLFLKKSGAPLSRDQVVEIFKLWKTKNMRLTIPLFLLYFVIIEAGFEYREKYILILAFLRPCYSDVFRMTAKGRASFRKMRNGEGERLGGHTFEPLS